MLSKIQIIGNAGADAELRTTESGAEVCTFNVAINIRRPIDPANPNTDWQTVRTDWYKIAVWGQRARPMVPRIKQGMQVFIDGTLTPGAYVSDDGSVRPSLDITADKVIPMRAAKPDNGGPPEEPNPPPPPVEPS